MGGKEIKLLVSSALKLFLSAEEDKGVIWGRECSYSTECWGDLSLGQALKLSCKTNEEINSATYQL